MTIPLEKVKKCHYNMAIKVISKIHSDKLAMQVSKKIIKAYVNKRKCHSLDIDFIYEYCRLLNLV